MTDTKLPAPGDLLDTDLLTAFCWVAKARNFSRAAERLNTSQPVITRKVGRLEEQLGVQLFVRTNRGCELTPPGEALVAKAPALLLQLEELKAEVSQSSDRVAGAISLGVTHLAGQILVPQLLPAIAARWPELRIHLVDSDSMLLRARVLSGDLSLAVCFDPPGDPDLVLTPLLIDKLCLVGRPGPEMSRLTQPTLRDLAALPLVLPGVAQTQRILLEDAFSEIGMPLRPVYEATTVNLLRAMAIHGAGYTVLAYGSVADDVAAGRLVARPLVDKGMSIGVTMITTRDQLRLRNVRLMSELVADQVRDLARRGVWPGHPVVVGP